jgi:hypothetical protein
MSAVTEQSIDPNTAVHEWPDRRVFEWAGYGPLAANRITVRQTHQWKTKAHVFAFTLRDSQTTGNIIVPKDEALRLAIALLRSAHIPADVVVEAMNAPEIEAKPAPVEPTSPAINL